MGSKGEGCSHSQVPQAAYDASGSAITSSTKKPSLSARSLNGCWTCRVRRKKCDESLPSCLNCSGLNLNCDGYGPRPTWLDGGILEKAKALKIKSIVKQTIKRRARSLSGLASIGRGLCSQTLIPVSSSSSSSSSSSWSSDPQSVQDGIICSPSTETCPSTFWDYSYNHLLRGPNYDIHGSEESNVYFSTFNSTHTEENQDEDQQRGSSSARCETNHDLLLPESISFNPQPLIAPSTDLEICTRMDTFQGTNNPYLGSAVYHAIKIDEARKSTLYEDPEVQSTITTEESNSCCPAALILPTASGDLGSHQASLLMHYLDHVFYAQFPFYGSFERSNGRGWLLSLLTEDRTIYCATLAISHYHRSSKCPWRKPETIEKARPTEEADYYVFALSQLQYLLGEADTWSGPKGVIRSVKVLTCILQFVFLDVGPNERLRISTVLVLNAEQVFSKSSGNWSFHLRAAGALLPALVEARIKHLHPRTPEVTDQELQDQYCLTQDDHIAIEFLLGAFSWLDTIAQISIRAKPSSSFNTQAVLEKGGIQLERLFGCQNWAITLVMETSKLDEWKRKCEKNRKLSVAELVRRGTKIETDINQGVVTLSSQRASQKRTDSSVIVEDNSLAITECFAFAALTYLHVVVSGAHPDLPELDDSVSRGICVLRNAADRKLLSRVVWPVCVLGCMVSESKQETFRALVSQEDVADSAVGTLSRAIEIVEHCWQKRHAGTGDFEWFSAMRSVGQHVLLL